jgi:hypothetical protein
MMRSFYLLLLVMLSLAEVLFTVVYLYLSQTLDGVIIIGAITYAGAIFSLHSNYLRDKYEEQKAELMENLISES